LDVAFLAGAFLDVAFVAPVFAGVTFADVFLAAVGFAGKAAFLAAPVFFSAALPDEADPRPRPPVAARAADVTSETARRTRPVMPLPLSTMMRPPAWLSVIL
jgi:hypothetical protein